MDKVIESVSARIANRLVVKKQIPPNKEGLYKYSALIAIQSAINILSTLIIGLLLGMFFENICFFIAFKFLRKFSGGLHSTKFSVCFLISVASNIIVLLIAKVLETYPNYMLIITIEAISFFIVLVFAPIINKNKSATSKESKIYKILCCLLCITLIIASLVLIANDCLIVCSISLAMLLNGVFIIVEKAKCIINNHKCK